MEQDLQTAESTENQTPTNDVQTDSSGGDTGSSSLAPDSANTQSLVDLEKVEKFLWEGKEMTAEELRKAVLMQKDYTKKTQSVAEERRKFDEERRAYILQQEQAEKYEQNVDADIQTVLRDPSRLNDFKSIYPQKYHAKLEQALSQTYGGDPEKRNESLLRQELKAVQDRLNAQDMERSRAAYDQEVQKNSEILDTLTSRLSTKYPMADEDSVLARAEYLTAEIKKDQNFMKNFSDTMEKLFSENHKYHEKRYQEKYKATVEKQKQANNKAKDIGRGGATPAAAPEKMKLKDVKNHILAQKGLDN